MLRLACVARAKKTLNRMMPRNQPENDIWALVSANKQQGKNAGRQII
jgi:hypothetical protein